MRRKALILPGLLALSLALAYGIGTLREGRDEGRDDLIAVPSIEGAPADGDLGEDARARQEAEHRAMLDREYPLVGAVTAAQIRVRSAPDRESLTIGWLRLGGHVRMRREPVVAPRCATGWYELYPRGYTCAGEGIEPREHGDEAPEGLGELSADRHSALPYRYMFVRDPQTPEYHQLPSREDQRAALDHGARYAQLLNDGQERRAELLREGRLGGEPEMPSVVVRYLHRGFYVASNGTEERSQRRFVRTVRGSYIKEAQLQEVDGSEFAGIELGDGVELPLAWASRTAVPLMRIVRSDGTDRFYPDPDAPTYERHTVVPWTRRARFGTRAYHVLTLENGEERYLRDWFVSVAEPVERPRSVRGEATWVHVDVSEQTAVLYRGDRPIYATLISSGLEGHDTPRGEFRIRRKFVSDTMANLGPDAGDDSYRIDDVPFTQYFSRSIALHGAFWHNQFGLRRSHGCVNLAPRDARYLFEHTEPAIPQGWHGVSTERGTGFEGSVVYVTD
ncbi:MAG: L,D-transpeptidase [Sandaracinaceae bacterium]